MKKFKDQNKKIDELHFDRDIEEDIVAFDKQSLFKPLPIEGCKKHILYAIDQNNCTIVVGETGSGKTTKIPQYLYEVGYTANGRKIGLTLPKRISVLNIAQRLAFNLNSNVGQEVGYSISFEAAYGANTQIKVMTDGMLVREMLIDPLLTNYQVIMVDDCHERSLYTDLLLGLLKKIWKKRPDLKVIISSATIDAEKYKDFFQKGGFKAQIIEIEGRMYPVEIHYLKQPCRDYVQSSLETVCLIHKTNPINGDVLVFLTGVEEIDRFQKAFANLQAEHLLKDDIFALPLYSGLGMHKQMDAFKPTPYGKRKVIVATNIAETSITIESIVYVIDCCHAKMKFFDAATDMENLIIVPASKSSCDQRAGRAGRVKPGKCYRLCTKKDFDEQMQKCTKPEIQRVNASYLLLQMKALGIRNILNFEFISPPSEEHIVKSLELLFALGALDDKTELTKEIGYKLVEFPLDPKLGTVLLRSNEEKFKCMDEILSLVAVLSVQNLFLSSRDPVAIAKAKKKDIGVIEGDHLTLLNAYNVYNRIKGNKNKEQYCRNHFINEKAMIRVGQIRLQLKSMLRQLKIEIKPNDDDDDYEGILKCVTAGYFTHVAQLQPDGSYRNVRNNSVLYIHPSSVLANLRPKWVVYHEIVATSFQYMREVSEIDPQWLLELAPQYFVDKRKDTLEQKHRMEIKRKVAVQPAPVLGEQPESIFGDSKKRKFRNVHQQFSTSKSSLPEQKDSKAKKTEASSTAKQSMINIEYDF